jgi:hypothetical protein
MWPFDIDPQFTALDLLASRCGLHNLVPHLGGLLVLAAERVAVDVVGRVYGGMAEALGDGREVHAVGQQEARVAVS